MDIPPYLRVSAIVGAVLSLLWLPWAMTLVFIFLAGLVFPPAALALGVLTDLLYYPGVGLPWGVITGALIMLVSALVRHFVKTSIM